MSLTAQQACVNCRQQKRKCDKLTPTCGLCSRLGKDCRYTDVPPAPTAEDLGVVMGRLQQLESQFVPFNADVYANTVGDAANQSHTSGFGLSLSALPKRNTTAVFLDWDAFRWSGAKLSRPDLSIPHEVLAFMPDENAIQQIASQYFATVHTWMPVISRKRMNLGHHLSEGGPDLALLFLCMKLVSTPLDEGADASSNHMYYVAKQFLLQLEVSGCMSILHLQAMLLVALYEFSHGVYPAAWMSVAGVVRYADVLGLPSLSDAKDLIGAPTTGTSIEERRRIWWAIFIMDRIICLGNKRRFLLPHPADDEILPSDDNDFDIGNFLTPSPPTASTPLSLSPSPFATLCQVAILVGNALESFTSADNASKRGRAPDIASLIDSISSLSEAKTAISIAMGTSPTTQSPLLPSYCLCESATMMVQDFFLCPSYIKYSQDRMPSEAETKAQLQSVPDMRASSVRLRQICLDITNQMADEQDLGRLSPLILDSLYCAAATVDWMYCESGDVEAKECLDVVKSCLAMIGGRWRAGIEYLQVLDQHDLAVRMSLDPS